MRKYVVSKASDQTGFEFNLENHQHIFSNLDCTILKQLIKGEKVQLFKETLPQDISYYVSRRIAHRNIISYDIFSEKSGKDIFLFSKLEMPELYMMAGNETTGYSKDCLEYPRIRFMVLNEPAHFDIICKRTSENVHLLEKDGILLKWKKTRGKVIVLQECQAKAQDGLRDDIFQAMEGHLPVIISDTAGMGKSTLLAKIGRLIRKANPTVLVSFAVFADLVHQIKDFSANGDTSLKEAIEAVVVTSLCFDNLGQEVLRFKLNQDEKQIELLLDGFDEIHSECTDLAIEILFIILSFKSLRVWVTSRPQFLHKLENTLNVMGFTIFPFNRKEQVDFLVSYWLHSKPIDEVKLRSFSELCLNTLNSCLSDRDKEITGIPLQCLMVGEIFEDYLEFENAETFLKSNIRSIADLYQRFIENKFKKYEKLYGLHPQQKKLLLEAHVQLSLELIFEYATKRVKRLFSRAFPSSESILNVGIVENWSGVDQPPKFVHRTFAEYLTAWFFTEKFTCNDENFWSKDMIEFFFSQILGVFGSDYAYYQHFGHSVVCHFLNSLLADLSFNNNLLPALRNMVREKVSLKKPSIKRICYAAVVDNYWGIFIFLDQLSVFDEVEREIFTKSFLDVSVRHGGIEIFEIALRHFENIYTYSKETTSDILRIVLEKGNFLIAQFLLKTKGLYEQAKTFNLPLLHYVVENTKGETPATLRQKKDIISVLCQQNPSLLELVDGNGNTALLSYSIHFELLHELVKLGANFLAKDTFGNTILHMQPSSYGFELKSDQLQKLLETMREINQPGLKTLFNTRGRHKMKPFMNILDSFDWNPPKETIEVATKMGVNLNELDRNGYTWLALAIRNGSSVETIRAFVELGADVNWKHHKTSQTLIHCAALECNLQIMRYLLDNHTFGINDVDYVKDSPLDIVARKILHFDTCDRVNDLECAMRLIHHGGEGRKTSLISVLHFAIALGEEESVKYLVGEKQIGVKKSRWSSIKTFWKTTTSRETHLNWSKNGHYLLRTFQNLLKANMVMDAKGLEDKTLVHVLMETYCGWDPELLHLFVKMLIKFDLGYILKKQDIYGNTPVAEGIRRVDISIKTFNLLNKVEFDWNSVSFLNENLLHQAVSSRRGTDVLKSLVRIGVDLKNVNLEGNGLLHACCKALNVAGMEFLLGLSKLDINYKNFKGQTPLQMATLDYWCDEKVLMKIIVLLLKNGAQYSDILDHSVPDIYADTDLTNINIEHLDATIKQAAKRLEKRSSSYISINKLVSYSGSSSSSIESYSSGEGSSD